MVRSTLIGVVLSVALLGGCATSSPSGGDGGSALAERVQQRLDSDPLLSGSRVTVTERDGVIVLGGFAEGLEDIDVIRDAVASVEGVTSVENNVVVEAN